MLTQDGVEEAVWSVNQGTRMQLHLKLFYKAIFGLFYLIAFCKTI